MYGKTKISTSLVTFLLSQHGTKKKKNAWTVLTVLNTLQGNDFGIFQRFLDNTSL